MSSASLFEQLTSSVSLSMVTIVSAATLALLLIYTVACRLFFSSSKSTSANKDKKSNTKKQQIETTSGDKKKNTKVKKNVVPVSSVSEESEEEKIAPVTPTKKSTPTSKKVAVASENNKTGAATNGIKTPPTKQQAAVRNENVEGSAGVQSGDNKKKQSKTGTSPISVNAAVAVNKQQTSGKGDATAKVNTAVSNKEQPIVVNSEVKFAPKVDGEAGSDQEDEGHWLTQSSKQVNNRNRTKGKPEPSNTNNQLSPIASSNRNVVSEKRSALTTSTSDTFSSTNKNDSDIEPAEQWNNSFENQEPIEICQLLPTNENRYTANDNWWKHALNKQQTFSINDIGEWPERDEDEQYVVQVKRIIPVKHNKVNEDDEQFNEQTNSSSIVTADSSATTFQPEKKTTKVRQLS